MADEELREALSIVADYFPESVKELARVCRAGNEQHNGDAPVLFWDRRKSSAHFQKGLGHWARRGQFDDDDGTRHTGKAAWRVLADLQIECERDGAPMAPAALRAPIPHDIAAAMKRDGIVSMPPNCEGHHACEAPLPPHVAEILDSRIPEDVSQVICRDGVVQNAAHLALLDPEKDDDEGEIAPDPRACPTGGCDE